MDRINVKIFVIALLGIGIIVLAVTAEIRLPGNNQGYSPVQPIAFSHRLHAGELSIDCAHCHYGARKSRTAGIPPASLCMNCHRDVTASYDVMLEEKLRAREAGSEPERILSPEIEKIYRALALDRDGNRDPAMAPEPIAWTRVHHLPDFVAFDHSVHVSRGLACQTCHGPVQTMDRLRQELPLSMGFCLDCHRTTRSMVPGSQDTASTLPDSDVSHVSTDCAACHY
jgi:hypothetical protein